MSSTRSMLARCMTALTVSGIFRPHDFGGERALARERALVAGDVVGACGLAVLDRDLHVIETGFGELAQRLRGDADRRGDEIGVKAGLVRRRGDRDEVAPRAGLAAGEMHLQHAEPGGFLKDTGPGLAYRVRLFAGPAPADWSNRDSRADSGASARPKGREDCAGPHHFPPSRVPVRPGRVHPAIRSYCQRTMRRGCATQGRAPSFAVTIPRAACRRARGATSSRRRECARAGPNRYSPSHRRWRRRWRRRCNA